MRTSLPSWALSRFSAGGVLYACWKGRKSLAGYRTGQTSKGEKNKTDAEFVGENEGRRCCVEGVGQVIILK